MSIYAIRLYIKCFRMQCCSQFVSWGVWYETYYKMSVYDAVLLKIYIQFGNVLGIIPLLSKSNTKGRTLIFNSYVLILFILFTITSVLELRGRLDFVYKRLKVTHNVLDFLESVIAFGFMASVLFGAIVSKQSWKMVLKQISVVDAKLKADVGNVNIFYYLRVLIWFLIFCLCDFFEIYLWQSAQHQMQIYYITYRIVKFYQIFLFLLINGIVELLLRRYRYLSVLVKNTFTADSNITYTKMKLREIKKIYVLLNATIEEINKIFGKSIAFIATLAIIFILNLWGWVIMILAEDLNAITKMKLFMSSVFLNSSIYIVSNNYINHFVTVVICLVKLQFMNFIRS